MAFGVPTPSTTVAATGNNNIDGLLSGVKWASNSVSFSFTDSINDYESGYANRASHAASFQTLNATQRAVARAWIGPGGAFYNVSLLNPTELTGTSDRDATIRMAMSNNPGTAYAYYPNSSFVEGGDVWFNKTSYNAPVIGNYAYFTFGHELGHALGLKHGHETDGVGNVAMNSDRDSMEFSIMTYRSYVGAPTDAVYNETWGYAQSLMMYDIAAIQHMYGARFDYNSSNTTYTFSTTTGEMFVNDVGQGTPGANRVFRTIWDGNGIDTYDFSNYSTNLSIDLTPGGWSDLDVGSNFQSAYLGNGNYARGQVFNALQYNGDARSLIENANGGSGNDKIVGNSANNVLNGNSGNDTIYAGEGNDTGYGGNGNDFLGGWSGNDSLSGDTGNDTLYGDSGIDTLDGAEGDDLLFGHTNNPSVIDTLGSDHNPDYLYGGTGNDTLVGGFGNDSLSGGAGAEQFTFYSSTEGIDTITDFLWQEGDQIAVSASGFGGGLTVGSLSGNQFTIGSAASTADHRFIYNSSTGAMFFDIDGTGGSAQVQFATLSTDLSLISSDILVIA